MALSAASIHPPHSSPSNEEEALTFPLLGRYESDAILRGAKYLAVYSGAEGKKISDFVLIKLGLLDPSTAPVENFSYQDKIEDALTNFSRLFEEGKCLMQSDNVKPLDIAQDQSFSISSPLDLLTANLALRNLAEKIIFNGLFSPKNQELSEAQRLRITQTKFLGPWTLSQMTGGKITTEEALILITCLGLKKANKKIHVCDPSTGNFHTEFKQNMLTSNPPYKLFFWAPEDLLKHHSLKIHSLNKDYRDARILFTGTKKIVETILQELKKSFPLSSHKKITEDLVKASVDHEEVLSVFARLEDYFPDEPRQTFLKCKNEIDRKTKKAFETCQNLIKDLPTQETLNEALKSLEAKARLERAVQQKDALLEKFNMFQGEILEYLRLVSEEYQIKNPKSIRIKWVIQNTEILETMEITKTCAIARRVLCPKTKEGNREDLVYFSSNSNEESVLSRWKSLCIENRLSDAQLAADLLLLYQGQKAPDEFAPFLSFLMVLLLGKEPAYDTASFAANFILLFSVKLGVQTFEEALLKMPMIPQGAIASKQFLLHVSGKPLDSLSRVQYKDKKRVAESSFLPISGSFLGSADDWIQVYDDVATTAIRCCRHLFFQGFDPKNPHLLELQEELKSFFNRTDLEVWDIPQFLNTFHERRFLLNPSERIDSFSKRFHQKNKLAANFLRAIGQPLHTVNNAAEECAKFLTAGIDPNHPKIKDLKQIIDQQSMEHWQQKMLSAKDISQKQDVVGAFQETIKKWDPVTVFQVKNINPYDYSDVEIKKMNNAWDDHFMECMKAHQDSTDFVELRSWSRNVYWAPVPYYELVCAIDPENAVSDEDPLAKWAISYVLDKHPLRTK